MTGALSIRLMILSGPPQRGQIAQNGSIDMFGKQQGALLMA
jgi:hypothetical protein